MKSKKRRTHAVSRQHTVGDTGRRWLQDIEQALHLMRFVITEGASNLTSLSGTTQDMHSNVVAALACFTRAYRNLEAATTLAKSGYGGQARILLRDVYESAGLARMLAHDPEAADQWVFREHWIPDGQVRRHIAQRIGEESRLAYDTFYQRASDMAHPTAQYTLPYLFAEDGRVRPQLKSRPNTVANDLTLLEVLLAAIFCCFAVRMAAVDESIIDPKWRQTLTELARRVTGQPLEHLDRDWQAERNEFARLRANVKTCDDLEDVLREHPNSYDNVRERADDLDAS